MLIEFKEYLLGIGKSENTALNYCDKVKLYFKWCLDSFGSEPQQLYRANVLDYISYMKTIKRYNPKSVNNHLSSLRSFNEFLIASGRQTELAIVKNDFMKIQIAYANPCTVEQKDVEAFRQRLLEGGSKRDFAIVTLLHQGLTDIVFVTSCKRGIFLISILIDITVAISAMNLNCQRTVVLGCN